MEYIFWAILGFLLGVLSHREFIYLCTLWKERFDEESEIPHSRHVGPNFTSGWPTASEVIFPKDPLSPEEIIAENQKNGVATTLSDLEDETSL